MSRNQLCPNWPAPVAVAKDDLNDFVNLSRRPPEERQKAFEAMKEHEPGMAEFVQSMRRSFGKSELMVDSKTARRLGMKP